MRHTVSLRFLPTTALWNFSLERGNQRGKEMNELPDDFIFIIPYSRKKVDAPHHLETYERIGFFEIFPFTTNHFLRTNFSLVRGIIGYPRFFPPVKGKEKD